jgi:hypothetical protein
LAFFVGIKYWPLDIYSLCLEILSVTNLVYFKT